jgi:hypothetical protein
MLGNRGLIVTRKLLNATVLASGEGRTQDALRKLTSSHSNPKSGRRPDPELRERSPSSQERRLFGDRRNRGFSSPPTVSEGAGLSSSGCWPRAMLVYLLMYISHSLLFNSYFWFVHGGIYLF